MWKISSFCQNNGGSCVAVGFFAKSSFSSNLNGCVVAGVERKSSLSFSNSNCVVAGVRDDGTGHVVLVRDDKDTSRPPVAYSLAAWKDFTGRVKNGEFPVIPGGIHRYVPGLEFDEGEWEAFTLGAKNPCPDHPGSGHNEFDLTDELEAELAAAAA